MAYGSERPRRENSKVTCDVLENLVVFGQRKDSGWTKEANIVCWNGGSPKLDIREWDPDHERMSKGITLYEAEAEKLARILCKRYGISEGGRKGNGSADDEAFAFAGEDCDAAENAMTEEAEEGGAS